MSLKQENLTAAPLIGEKSELKTFIADALKVAKSEAFILGTLFLVALAMCFWPLFRRLPSDWFGTDTYYNHGPLIPIMAGYMIYDRWTKIKKTPVRPFYPALVPIVVLLYANFVAINAPRALFMSAILVLTIGLGILFVAGWKWLGALAVPTLFLLFGLPNQVWETVIDVYTQPMQNVSTDLAFSMLRAVGYDPLRVDDTTIWLNHFQMFVGVPCSGLRMILAMIALVVFCVVTGRMRWWANLILAAMAIPVCIFVNSFRIALIGIIGETYGNDAGRQFHDTSGYISIVLLIVILWQITKALEVKS